MADFRRSMLGLFQQGMDAVNSAVNHVTNATRSKMDELALQTQRKELLDALATHVFDLWKKGETLPASLTDTLRQLQDVVDQLDAIANEKAKMAAESHQQVPTAQQTEPAEEQEEPVPTLEVKEEDVPNWPDPPVQSAVPQIDVQEETAEEKE